MPRTLAGLDITKRMLLIEFLKLLAQWERREHERIMQEKVVQELIGRLH